MGASDPGLRRLTVAGSRTAVADCVLLAAASTLTFWIVTYLLSPLYVVSGDDRLLGGMWAVIATVFVCRYSYAESIRAAVTRLSATTISFALCLVYLVFLPFHVWSLALLIGASALVATLIGRPGDAVTAAITTTVVLVLAAVSPHDAWRQPIFRLADTIVGVAVGVGAALIGLRVLPGLGPGGHGAGDHSAGDHSAGHHGHG